ncbi:MAG: hypothetical protein JNM65_13300 [Verrucomicrobiaceae bacterium]|nr:hypothetical protein [Verrucomicrobiaceae bacterium]
MRRPAERLDPHTGDAFTIRHWSKIDRSDSSAGGGELRKLSCDFGQN